MWTNFDGKPYTRDEFTAHVATLKWVTWHPKFVVLHNTGGPTLRQWYDGGATPAQRIKNLEHYYEVNEHWHAGPHLFIDRDHVWGFTDLTVPGVHASCFNSNSIGIEMVGDFGTEPFDPQVRDLTVHALAVLHRALNLRPDGLAYGRSGLHFHVDCKRDGHACPGKHVERADMVARTLAVMASLGAAHTSNTAAKTASGIAPLVAVGIDAGPAKPALSINADTTKAQLPYPPPEGTILGRGSGGAAVSWVQAVLARLGYGTKVDGGYGAATEAAVRKFQATYTMLDADGVAGPETMRMLRQQASIAGAAK